MGIADALITNDKKGDWMRKMRMGVMHEYTVECGGFFP